jgi:hypothetical protein
LSNAQATTILAAQDKSTTQRGHLLANDRDATSPQPLAQPPGFSAIRFSRRLQRKPPLRGRGCGGHDAPPYGSATPAIQPSADHTILWLSHALANPLRRARATSKPRSHLAGALSASLASLLISSAARVVSMSPFRAALSAIFCAAPLISLLRPAYTHAVLC